MHVQRYRDRLPAQSAGKTWARTHEILVEYAIHAHKIEKFQIKRKSED